MANANKNKGKSFERDISKLLSEIYGISFRRVPCSGSITGGSNAHVFDTLTPEQKLICDGDIIVPEFLSHISIECKSYKNISFNQFFDGKCKQLDTWIGQASATKKSHWILLFKINNKGTYIVYDYEKFKGCNRNVNHMRYANQYVIESAEPFLKNNAQFLKTLKKVD
jgi:Holliday junction resolvase